MGCRAYRVLATMGYGTHGMIMEIPNGGPSALLSVASTWILGIEWYSWLKNSSFQTVVV